MVNLKRVFVYLFCLSLVVACGKNKYLIPDKDVLGPKDGILAFNFSVMHGSSDTYNSVYVRINKFQEENIYFDFSIPFNKSPQFIFRDLPEGYYYISKIIVEKEGSAVGQIQVYSAPIFQNLFEVEAQKINYIGSILVQTEREPVGKEFLLKNSDGLEGRFYFFDHYSQEDLSFIENRYPVLSKLYSVVEKQIFYDIGKDGSINTPKKPRSNWKTFGSKINFSYGENNHGLDPMGYGEFKWNMTAEDMKNLLEQKISPYEEEENVQILSFEDLDKLIQQEVSGESLEKGSKSDRIIEKHERFIFVNPTGIEQIRFTNRAYYEKALLDAMKLDGVRFYFSDISPGLYKIVFDCYGKYEDILNLIKQEHGSAVEVSGKSTAKVLKWELPRTFILLVSTSDYQQRVIFLNKEYLLNF